MVHQNNEQTVCVRPPALYGTYEGEYHESQFECEKEKKWYEELKTSRTLVAPCDARDNARCIWCGDGSGEGNAERRYEKSEKGGRHGCE